MTGEYTAGGTSVDQKTFPTKAVMEIQEWGTGGQGIQFLRLPPVREFPW